MRDLEAASDRIAQKHVTERRTNQTTNKSNTAATFKDRVGGTHIED